jgi:hypothetical protein
VAARYLKSHRATATKFLLIAAQNKATAITQNHEFASTRVNGWACRSALGLANILFPPTIVRRCCFRAIAKRSHCCHDPFMPVEMTSAATWLGSAHLRLGACAGPPIAVRDLSPVCCREPVDKPCTTSARERRREFRSRALLIAKCGPIQAWSKSGRWP